MVTEEFVNHNHTPGRGHPNLGGHDAHVGKEVAIGMRGGRSFDKSLAESQHYQLHRSEIATLPKRARRELHRHILGIANAHERAQGYPGHAFAADVEEFYNKVHSKESGQFAPPNTSAVTADKNAKAQEKKAATAKDAKATKKPDTSNWHRDRIIADALAKLKEGPKSSGGSSNSKPTVGKYRAATPGTSKATKPSMVAKPKFMKASAAYAAVEEFYNHHHSPADGKFTGTTTSPGGTTPGGIVKHRTNRTPLGNGLFPSKMRDQDTKSRKYHELRDLKETWRIKNAKRLGYNFAAEQAVLEFVNHNHTPTRGHPNAGGSWTKVNAGKYAFGSAVVEQVHSRAFGKSWVMRVGGKRVDVSGGVSTLKQAQSVVEGYLHGRASTPDAARMSSPTTPLYAQTDYHRGFATGNAIHVVTQKTVQAVKAPGGGTTVHPVTGQEPITGFAVAHHGTDVGMHITKAFDEQGNPTSALIDMIHNKIDELPEGAAAHLGSWHDPSNGRVEVNRTSVITNREKAIRLAQAGDQKEIWDIKNGVGIPTGGTGDGGINLDVERFVEEFFNPNHSPHDGRFTSAGGGSGGLHEHLLKTMDVNGHTGRMDAHKIAHELNKQGFTANHGGKWSAKDVHNETKVALEARGKANAAKAKAWVATHPLRPMTREEKVMSEIGRKVRTEQKLSEHELKLWTESGRSAPDPYPRSRYDAPPFQHIYMPGLPFAIDQFVEEFRAGRSPYAGNSKSIGGRSPSLKWPHLYDILQAKGYDKESSAAISNSRVWARKNGQLGGLPWAKADNPKALKDVLTKYQAKHGKKA